MDTLSGVMNYTSILLINFPHPTMKQAVALMWRAKMKQWSMDVIETTYRSTFIAIITLHVKKNLLSLIEKP